MGDADSSFAFLRQHPEKQELVAKSPVAAAAAPVSPVPPAVDEADSAVHAEVGEAALAAGMSKFAEAEATCRGQFPIGTDAVRVAVRKAVEAARGAFAEEIASEKIAPQGAALDAYRRKLDDSMAQWSGREGDGAGGEVMVEVVEGIARLVRVRAASGRCAALVEENHKALMQAFSQPPSKTCH